MAVPIEKGVAKPDNKKRADRRPWKELQIGDSFFIQCIGALEQERVFANMGSQCCNSGKRLGRAFSVRRVPNGVRVWRDK